MKDLDDDLRNALGREEPPAGFAERVLRHVAGQPAMTLQRQPASAGLVRPQADPTSAAVGTSSRRSKLPFIHWAAAAALVAAVAGGFEFVSKQKERAEGEAARERVVLALHIAGTKLQLVQTKINQLHEQPEKNATQ